MRDDVTAGPAANASRRVFQENADSNDANDANENVDPNEPPDPMDRTE